MLKSFRKTQKIQTPVLISKHRTNCSKVCIEDMFNNMTAEKIEKYRKQSNDATSFIFGLPRVFLRLHQGFAHLKRTLVAMLCPAYSIKTVSSER